ncbi:hypothetical protein PR003_g20903 [Phytophthora rubi]|uniref:PiggyBac transposable element-derived protein domain-containing protein n=1 Tax=Phytophthora rubi TaxID=129364 RepID=A0A6A4DI66_9STRA|nr:hypothetical protein PR003_g20903 [Phytophthora rubi]
MNGPGEKTFKQFWRELSKEGWKPRKPTVLTKHQSYVKPGIKGRLDNAKRGEHYVVGKVFAWEKCKFVANAYDKWQTRRLWTTLRTSRASTPVPTSVGMPQRVTTGKLASYAVVAHAPLGRLPPSPDPVAHNAAAGATQVDPSTVSPAASASVATAQATTESASDAAPASIPDDTEQAQLVSVVIPESVGDAAPASVPDDTEQDQLESVGNPKEGGQTHASDDEESKSGGGTQDGVEFEIFDSDDFMEDSPPALFFYFLPKEHWIRIADETNQYRAQNISAVAAARQAQDPRVSVPNLEEIDQGLSKLKRIKPHEIVHVIVLLIARTIGPIRDGLAKHWATEEDGAIPRGTFSRFMKRSRFEAILQFLHFNNNAEGEAHLDEAWKIRPVLQTVDKTFRRGYRLGKVIPFGEGMMPNRSKYNPMHVFMPDKPSKYGTNVYMTCCAETAYCSQ